MVIVNKKQELKDALKNKEETILIRGKLARKISKLEKFKKTEKCDELCENLSKVRAVATISSLGVPVVVAITLIITLGVVSIVAILKNYTIKVKKGEKSGFEVELNKE